MKSENSFVWDRLKNIDMFNLPIFLLLTPMFLFSGTFFPIDTLPGWAQTAAWTLPLTHLVALARVMTFGVLTWRDALISGGYLLVLTAICFPLALIAMRRRLIK